MLCRLTDVCHRFHPNSCHTAQLLEQKTLQMYVLLSFLPNFMTTFLFVAYKMALMRPVFLSLFLKRCPCSAGAKVMPLGWSGRGAWGVALGAFLLAK